MSDCAARSRSSSSPSVARLASSSAPPTYVAMARACARPVVRWSSRPAGVSRTSVPRASSGGVARSTRPRAASRSTMRLSEGWLSRMYALRSRSRIPSSGPFVSENSTSYSRRVRPSQTGSDCSRRMIATWARKRDSHVSTARRGQYASQK
ncbi:Uncharacterised protein [Mycobacteroides abscessus]|nr:Uncharacterised protein [Mycobacteroides abscessus]